MGNHDNPGNVPDGVLRNPVLRILLLAAGWILVGFALLGIVLPLLPTTPFLLLAAACFYKSSSRFYRWLFSNSYFGNYLQDYKEKKGVPVKVKLGALLFLWTSLFVSVYLIPILWLRLLLMAIGIAVTLHLLMIRTKPSGKNGPEIFPDG